MPRYSRRRARERASRQPDDLKTIEEFCEANRISESMFYKLKRMRPSKAPRTLKVGKRILITPEAEAEWRREREKD